MISITTSTLYFFYIVCATYMQYIGLSMVGIFFALPIVLLFFFFLIKMLRSSPTCLRRQNNAIVYMWINMFDIHLYKQIIDYWKIVK